MASRRILKLSVFFSICMLVAFTLMWQPTQAHADTTALTPRKAIEQAWEKAQNSGSYGYRAQIEQTTYPAPKVINTGSSPQKDNLAIAGTIDQDAGNMSMTVWLDGSFNPNTGYEIKVEGNQAYGRSGQGEWEEIENVADSFAPGSDPLGFLAGVTNIQNQGTEEFQFPEVEMQLTYDHYTFDFDGAKFADYLRDQVEQNLQERGELPSGVTFEPSAIYRQSTGSGEIWLDEQGLPARLSIDLDLGTQNNGDRVRASITTDYSGFDLSRIETVSTGLWQSPTTWLHAQITYNDLAQKVFLAMSFMLIGLATALFVWRYWHTRKFQNLVISCLVVIMVVSPLLRANEVHAFNERQYARAQSALSAETASANEGLSALESNTWNPNQNPLAATAVTQTATKNLLPALAAVTQGTTNADVDSDGDGLSDADEADWETCETPDLSGTYCDGVVDATDSDGDGLSDGDEVNGLGTIPTLADSDGDLITDNLEVQGFVYGGQTWYLNPMDVDTDHDGMPDGFDCNVWAVESANYDPNGSCADTDSDGMPDVFDDDNDGDGVEDRLDISPFQVMDETFDDSNPLEIAVNDFAVDTPLTVQFQIRPTDAKQLTYNGRILDWPTGDTEGQIQRHLDTTFASTANTSIRSSDYRAGNGDIRLIPMLEITMPYSDGHYSNLPVNSTYTNVARTLDITSTQWLDTTDLDQFGITVTEADDGGDLLAYVPLNLETSYVGDEAQVFAGTMYYQPNDSSWGNVQQVRLVWLVQMITDTCTQYAEDDGNSSTIEDCLAYEDTLQIIHVYQDESWELTGLSVTEQHGAKLAVVYEDPSVDQDLGFDDNLMLTSWNMGQIWLEGRDCDEVGVNQGCVAIPDGERDVTLDNLESTINTVWDTGATAYMAVYTSTYKHPNSLVAGTGTVADSILANVFGNYQDQTNPTLLFASETAARTVSMQDSTNTTQTNNLLTLSLGETIKESTTAHMRWVTYNFDDDSNEWDIYPVDTQMETLVDRVTLENSETFFNDPNDTEGNKEGKQFVLQLYYLTLFNGISGLVKPDSGPVLNATSVDPSLLTFDHSAKLNGAKGVANKVAVSLLGKGGGKGVESLYWKLDNANLLKSRKFGSGSMGYAASSLELTLFAVNTGFAIAAEATGDKDIAKAAQITSVVAGTISNALAIGRQIYKTAKDGTTYLIDETSVISQSRGALIGLVLDLSIAWGTFFAMTSQTGWSGVAFHTLLATAITQSIIAIITFVISVFVPFGGIVMALFNLADEFVKLFSKTSLSYRAIINDLITNAIYKPGTIIKNMDSSYRLDVDFRDSTLGNPELGYTVQNSVTTSFDVGTYLLASGDQGESGARRPTFRYWLQTVKADHDDSIDQNQMANEWTLQASEKDTISGHVDLYSVYKSDTYSKTIPFSKYGTGINRRSYLVLNEAYAAPWYECWGNFLGFSTHCDWKAEKDTLHYVFTQKYDILPNTLSEFAAMNWNNGDAGLDFPKQQDRDSDGLLGGFGDPNDQKQDTDGDGLTDLYEYQNGTSLTLKDTDKDGLTDKEEELFGSNPRLVDSDGDGLSDYTEVKTGWLIDYGAGVTRVWSDPERIDADGDRYTDRMEAMLGLNPNVATDPSEVRDYVQIDGMDIYETDAPTFLFQFDEGAINDSFHDDSGNKFVATCDSAAGTCPQEGQDGRFGSALYFDGTSDYATIADTDAIDFGTDEDFTVSVWVKPDSVQSDLNHIDNSIVEKWSSSGGYPYVIRYRNQTSSNPGHILVARYDGSSLKNNPSITSNASINDGEFHHIVFTKQGETLSLYLDDVLQGTTEDITVGSTTNNSDLYLGMRGGNRNYFQGYVDELAVFDHGLTTDEVDDLFYGRYNLNDLTLTPGQEISYQATITNTNGTLDASGFLRAESNYTGMTLPLTVQRFEPEDYMFNFAVSDSFIGTKLDNGNVFCLLDTCPALGTAAEEGNAITFNDPSEVVYLPALGLPYEKTSYIPYPHITLRVEALPAAGEVAYIIDTDRTVDSAFDMYIDSTGDLYIDVAGETPQLVQNLSGSLNQWVSVSIGETYLSSGIYLGPGTLGNSVAGDAPFVGSIDYLYLMNKALNFDETAFDNISFMDRATESNTGFCPNGTTCPVIVDGGAVGSAVEFSGLITDYIQLEDEERYDLNHMTVAGWIKVEPNSYVEENGVMVTKGDGAWSLSNSSISDQNLRLSFFTPGLSNAELIADATFNDGKWHHVAAVYDGSHKYLYIDGEVNVQVAATGELGTNDTPVTIGADPNKLYSGLPGMLDEIMIFPDALEADEIKALMNGVYPGLSIDNPVTTFTVAPETSAVVEGTAQVGSDPWPGVYEFEQEVAATLPSDVAIIDPAVIDATLTDHYAFDDAPGSTLFENSQTSDTAYWADCSKFDIPNTCPTVGVPGVIGTAAYFDGVDDGILQTYRTTYNYVGTISMWVKADRGILLDFNPVNYGYLNRARIGFEKLYAGFNNYNIKTVSYDIPENEWTHLVITGDPIVVYINGVEVARDNSAHISMGGILNIGSDNYGTNSLHGYIDDLRIYDDVLTADEVQDLYKLTGPVLNFGFNETEDETLFVDSSANEYIGAPSGHFCTKLTLDELTGYNFSDDSGYLYATLDGDQILYEPVTTPMSLDLSVSTPLCEQQTLEVGEILKDGSSNVMGTVSLDTATGFANTPQTATQSFISPRITTFLTWTIDNDPYFVPNPAPGTDGQIGNTALFDGEGYITVTDPAVFQDLGDSFTIMTWLNPDDLTGTQRIVDTALTTSSDNGFGFGLQGNRFELQGYNPSNTWSSDLNAAVAGVWQHVAVVVDTVNNQVRYYVNGQPFSQKSNPDITQNTDDVMLIGQGIDADGSSRWPFQGQLDELKIYNRALSDAEIDSIYAQEVRWYSDYQRVYLTVDQDDPSVSMAVDSTYLQPGFHQLLVTTSDPTSQVTLVDFGLKVPGATEFAWVSAPECADASRSGVAWCPSFDTTSLANWEGAYELQFRAVDAVGHETYSSVYTIYVDGTAPVITTAYTGGWETAVADADVDLNYTVSLSGNISDPTLADGQAGSGVLTQTDISTATVSINLVDSLGTELGQQTAVTDGSTWSLDYLIEGEVPTGLYTIMAQGEDIAGNTGTALPVGTIQFDTQASRVELNPDLLSSISTISDTISVITGTTALRGVASEQTTWSDEVVQYHFEESIGATFTDYSGEGYNATCVTCPASVADSSPFGRALSFDGSDDALTVNGSFDTLGDDSFTVSAWISHTGSNDWNNIVTQEPTDGTTAGWALRLNDDNRAAFSVGNGAASWEAVSSDPLQASQWIHVAGVVDRSNDQIRLYVDGQEADVQLDITGSFTNTANILIGRGADANSNYFNGYMDEVTIYDQALSESQIHALAQANVYGISSVDVSIEAYDINTGTFSDINWQPTTLEQTGVGLTNWSYLLPDTQTEGFYQIRLRSSDAGGNTDQGKIVWRGLMGAYLDLTPLSAWSFGEGTGTTTADVTGNGYDGTLNGNVTWSPDTPSGSGYSLAFDGTNGYVSVPSTFNAADGAFSATAWFNVTEHNNGHIILSQPAGTGAAVAWAAINGSGYIYSWLGGSRMLSPDSVTTGEWHQVAMTYDPDTQVKSMYLDGVLVASETTVMPSNTAGFYIGTNDALAKYFKGNLDDIAIYGKALSAAEVAALYDAGSNSLSGTAVGGFTPTAIITLGSILFLLLGGFFLFGRTQKRNRYQ